MVRVQPESAAGGATLPLANLPPVREGGLRFSGVRKASCAGEPLVTIITATFNAADDLLRTIRSISSLHYRNVEWIVIDGGSTDRTVEVIREHEDNIDYWLSEADRGIYDAWNKGVLQAGGEWIAFLGAGDCYDPDALNRYVNAILSSRANVNLLSSRVRHLKRDGKVLRVWGGRMDLAKLRRYLPIGHAGSLHHRCLFERYGSFETSYKSAADYEFLMRCGTGLAPLYLDRVTTDMLVGGVSMGYRGLFESYRIQRKFGESPVAAVWLGIACVKRFVRPWVRGY